LSHSAIVGTKTAMADMKQDLKSVDDQQNYSIGNSSDPKNMQELTQHVSSKTPCIKAKSEGFGLITWAVPVVIREVTYN
jgi:hypothetical protein